MGCELDSISLGAPTKIKTHMRIIRKPAIYFAMSMLMLTQTGCFGEFALVRKVYNWNQDVVSSRFVQTLLFYVMNIIPVYGIAGMIDFWIFNLIEFWSGNNPIAMKDGDHEMQLVTLDGVDFKIEATKDTFTTTQLTGEQAGEVRVLKFDRKSRTWNYSDRTTASIPVLTLLGESEGVRIHTAGGPTDLTMIDLQGNDLLMAKLGCVTDETMAFAK
jgi:hypothetical protein